MPRFSFSDIIGIAGIVLAVVLIVLDKAGKLRGPWLFILLGAAALMTMGIAIGNAWVMDAPQEWMFWRGGLMVCVVVLTYSGIGIWISPHPSAAVNVSPKTPGLVFVFGVPLGDNASSVWMMVLKHYGPESAHNCTISFYDKDRKNIEHLWLLNHGSPPFLPAGQFEPSQQTVYVPEADPEGVIPGNFLWSPLDPDRQHHEVSICCRDGVFVEKWEVTRVDGTLRSRLVIEHGPEWIRQNPDLNPTVFKCEDPEFLSTPLLTEVPNRPKKVVHPGWKPNYKVEIPMAIIDPNGSLQIAAAVGDRTDFGCWNILTKHFGDAPAKPHQP
jgi:hypothetical protein